MKPGNRLDKVAVPIPATYMDRQMREGIICIVASFLRKEVFDLADEGFKN